ncbi:MAG: Hpt domain-containing protein, partial [Acidimicrobiia bacterium]|nr:Hpt domain-containing protein [Acidimicrobiia bacterium]
MDPLDDFFRQAVDGLSLELDEALSKWQATSDDADVRRLCHSIKGSGGSFGFPLVSVLAAAAEKAAPEE